MWDHHYFFVNHLHFPIVACWPFIIPYIILCFFRHTENVYPVNKLLISGCAAEALLYPFYDYYDWSFFIWWFVLTFMALGCLYCKDFNLPQWKKDEFGEYPLFVGPKQKNWFSTASLHENVQIVGGTGTGKTHYVIKPFIEQTVLQGLGCFIYDAKSNMVRDVAHYSNCAQRDYLHFNLVNPKQSHTYNPLFGDNPDAIANRVHAALYYERNSGETYYQDLAAAFLRNLVGLLMMEIKTLTFQDLLSATQEADTFKTISLFCAKYPNNGYANYFRDVWLGKSPKERRMELSGLVNKLQRFCTSEWSFLLNVRDPDIQMEKVMSEGQILLFSPDSARYLEDAKALSILAMMDMSEQLSHRYRRSGLKPFRVFLDEFYNLAYPRFIDFINKCREAKVNLFLAHQSMGDLSGVSPEFQEQVMNTASNKIVLRVNDPDTAESFARQFGTELDKNHRVESFQSDGTPAGYSMAPVEMFRFHPNLIKELKVGQAIVKIVGASGVTIFQTQLRFATQAPGLFEPELYLKPLKYRSGEIETSLPEIIKPVNEGSRGLKKSFSLGVE
jgi:type IV secretory pathway TraG/TraD family ATPase VirD4